MRDDQVQSAAEKGFSRFDTMPRRRAGRVGKGNEIEFVSGVSDAEFLADDGVEFLNRDKLFNGELADGKDKFGLEDFNLAFEPGGAVADFIG